jgi:hypothetical protein
MDADSSFTCPYCDTELQLPDGVWYYTCTHCRNRLDLKSQFAYLRGLDAFSEGQEIMSKISTRKRLMPFYPRLAEPQRSLGVEMMSSMANEFMKREMVSPFERSYWNTLMVEQTAQDEYDHLKVKLSNTAGVFGGLKRIRWRARQKQLIQSLVELDKRLEKLEKQISFIDVPRARKQKWKP